MREFFLEAAFEIEFLYWILCHEIEEFDPELKGISTSRSKNGLLLCNVRLMNLD
jgi:hypothetical protein